jgi:hypothetical protein
MPNETSPPAPGMITDIHIKLDASTLAALDGLRHRYAVRGVLTSRASMARLSIQMLASDPTLPAPNPTA